MACSAEFRIIIVGGGIAGLAAAIALRAEGRLITVLEQSSLHTEIGATISLQPNASRILTEQWRLGDALKVARGMVDRGFRVYNTEGELVKTLPLVSRTEYGGDRIMYHRQDLHDCLKQVATSSDRHGPPAVIRVSSKVVSCQCEAGIVQLDSGEKLEADLIVGADGIHSVLRDSVSPEGSKPIPTGLSAYRLMLPSAVIERDAPQFCANIDPREPYTSMIMAHQCRLIMGPARNGDLYSLVGLVPDDQMNEDPNSKQSWVSKGSISKMLDTYQEFPHWIKSLLTAANQQDIGLWQLRDIEPLKTWYKGRVILIGDAAHAMLPTQGQGASQSIEDAEALGAFFSDTLGCPSLENVTDILADVFKCRYERASLIQRYSREAAKPATAKHDNRITMRPDEFMDYNCLYKGAKEWQRSQAATTVAC